MKIKLILLLLCLVSVNFQAQQTTGQNNLNHDSIRRRFSVDSNTIYKNKPVTLYASLDFRNAYVGERFLSFVGPMAGVTLNNKHIVGVGYYFLNKFSPFQSDKITTYSFEKMNYFSAFYQYILFDSKQFDIILPVEIGYGSYRALIEDGTLNNYAESNIAPLAIGVRCVLLPHKWIGLKVGVGYRYVWEKSSQIGLGGLYFALGIKIDLRHIYQDYRYYRLKQKYKHFL